ncbi:MAG: hypothetical protein A2X05_06530 [Bacteroidetes bacterium GWE2_41_25]|nr:MAG: hypothetical protein A2X03_18215 [Bacteroidetes bacterium GWA2_40_15]OFX92256.1 MAG: hypothetical protein A2X06_07090 [Bacteroidetes bacterium GWC2_40_22]OFY13308.1 MAG: hypothetical protein A2X05_06530 [Bacteroidetes bacterium GWE2_41_25]OFY58892.1 MAG: hypothetical protein A2X04_07105 [Bacteroidetes bacterium GWF2_41_9]HBH82903.1 hypothetical protein [Bacteroidales bacterium]
MFRTSKGKKFRSYFAVGSIKNWEKAEAVEIVSQNINVPIITCDDFMMPYCVFGMTKVAFEQGEWAAKLIIIINVQD